MHLLPGLLLLPLFELCCCKLLSHFELPSFCLLLRCEICCLLPLVLESSLELCGNCCLFHLLSVLKFCCVCCVLGLQELLADVVQVLELLLRSCL